MPLENNSQAININYRKIVLVVLLFILLGLVAWQAGVNLDVQKLTADVYNNFLTFLAPGLISDSRPVFHEEIPVSDINLEGLASKLETSEEEVSEERIMEESQEAVQKEGAEGKETGEKSEVEQMKDKIKELRKEIRDMQVQLNQMQNRVDELQERIDQLQS